MSSIDGDVLIETIAVNVTEGFLGAACGEDELFARDFTLDEQGLDCGGAFKAGKDRVVFSDLGDCLLKGKIWILRIWHREFD